MTWKKRDYRQTTSVSEVISELRWQSLEDCRKKACLSLFYKGLHCLAAIPVNELQRPTRCTRYCGTDTFTDMSTGVGSGGYAGDVTPQLFMLRGY